MLVIDRVELERLADFGAKLYVTCHRTERAQRPQSSSEPIIAGCDQLIAGVIRDVVLRGDLVAAARIMIDPDTRCCCGIRFLAQAERYLDGAVVSELQAIWEQSPTDLNNLEL